MEPIQKIIYETDLYRLLEKNGALERINVGKLTCFVCNRRISDWKKISRIMRKETSLQYVCDTADCVYRAAKKAAS